jgi:hypothetical protein
VVPITHTHLKLVGGLEHFIFFHILGTTIPTDELIFFRGVETTNQTIILLWLKHCPKRGFTGRVIAETGGCSRQSGEGMSLCQIQQYQEDVRQFLVGVQFLE